MITRRRFLTISAVSAAMAGRAMAETWSGIALGADVAITLEGRGAGDALRELPAFIDRIEETFSLFRASELQRVNNAGEAEVSDWLAEALRLSGDIHTATHGAFDPTVQPLWRAIADGGDIGAAQGLIGWERVTLSGNQVRLGHGQALTLNGIAQGFAADLVKAWLAERGFSDALVNMGEYAALGGPYRIGLDTLGAATIRGTSLAISRPAAMTIGGQTHILHPQGKAPLWKAIAVEADSAGIADGLSTGLVFMEKPQITALVATMPTLHRVWIENEAGLSVVT
ncbi:FAD:protein FMN transferase [Marivivens donghaensis]|uniref:FAD:protein FMN transferase n=1 Tax=Marivivens donghaensis TaxID=1699413 RepID=A0ABX0VZU8_9RHOB|nr:FAD:protein FMN transferase [Marivivens donghaensis]NIY73481.1 FAD:protein FMN transferase [Marivivens donghaensis]